MPVSAVGSLLARELFRFSDVGAETEEMAAVGVIVWNIRSSLSVLVLLLLIALLLVVFCLRRRLLGGGASSASVASTNAGGE